VTIAWLWWGRFCRFGVFPSCDVERVLLGLRGLAFGFVHFGLLGVDAVDVRSLAGVLTFGHSFGEESRSAKITGFEQSVEFHVVNVMDVFLRRFFLLSYGPRIIGAYLFILIKLLP
jgi:hypothetical protein